MKLELLLVITVVVFVIIFLAPRGRYSSSAMAPAPSAVNQERILRAFDRVSRLEKESEDVTRPVSMTHPMELREKSAVSSVMASTREIGFSETLIPVEPTTSEDDYE